MRCTIWSTLIVILQMHLREVNCEDEDKLRVTRNYSPHVQQEDGYVGPTPRSKLGRNGPVLFPESPPPTNRPLIVTSRPFVQRVTPNKGQQAYGVYRRPNSDYVDYVYDANLQDFAALGALQQAGLALSRNRTGNVLNKHPYAGVARKLKKLTNGYQGKGYSSHERQTVLPPIYNALENYARTKVLKSKKKSKSRPRNRNSDGIDDEYYNDNSGNEAKQYAFSYAVRDHQTGDDFSHSQHHTGSATNGEYRVKLPDGRLQIVSYTADNGGYKAEVRYEEDPDVQKETVQYQNNVLTSPAPKTQRPETLGTIVVPSHEYQDYEVDFVNYYDEQTEGPPKEVIITSKPTYTHTTQPNHLYKQVLYHREVTSPRYYSTTPRYEDNSISTPGYVSSTPAPLEVYDHLDTPNVNAKVQVKYTSVAPTGYRVVETTTPPTEVDTQRPRYFAGDLQGIDLRKYFSFGGK